jgi:hypothetical protein
MSERKKKERRVEGKGEEERGRKGEENSSLYCVKMINVTVMGIKLSAFVSPS